MGSIQGDSPDVINVQVFAPDHNIQKCLQVNLEDTVWDVKQKFLSHLPKDVEEGFNFGLFLPPCNGRAGKFLLEQRAFRDYPFQDCVPYLELKYKKRVYKMLNMDDKILKQLHSRSNLKKFMDLVSKNQVEKVDKFVKHGLDPNFHDPQGETPLTLAAGMAKSRDMILALVSGGAHLDFRNLEGQTPLHKAAFTSWPENVKTLLELGASPNYKDPLGLTPLYYCMLQPGSSADAAELFLRDYADLGVSDPHGNQEIHQACKNGLVQHLEHLLYYGADINSQNVNGNTPLHVCAVNDRENCARVLLFRGADAEVFNKQDQSAALVGTICGHKAVVDVIRSHDPSQAVPYRGMPRYNSKRRLTWSSRNLSRARSFSQSSDYGTLPLGGARSISRISSIDLCSSGAASPVPSIASTSTITGPPPPRLAPEPIMSSTLIGENRSVSNSTRSIRKSVSETTDLRQNGVQNHQNGVSMRNGPCPQEGVYGTLKKFPADSVHNQNPAVVLNADVNIPRILVIPRGPKGFGFILRGAKKMDEGITFEPTPAIPALQFFEGVDMNGMAMKAGLKPGDFLLEINGVDVRCASHDQVVRLIQMSGDTISLKVITIDTAAAGHQPYYGTLPGRRKQMQIPPPPLRHPSTSLSTARGRHYAYGLQQALESTFEEDSGDRHQRALHPAKSMEHLPTGHKETQHTWHAVQLREEREKVASVRGRVNSRRISAAELEQLMARQNSSEMDSSIDSVPGTPTGARPAPRVYASVADMKKRAKQGKVVPPPPVPPPPGLPRTPPDTPTLKSFHSSPDLQKEQSQHNGISSELALARDIASPHQQQLPHNGNYSSMANRYWRQASVDTASPSPRTPSSTQSFQRVVSVEVNGSGNYSTPRQLLRPKTPPPPPPAAIPPPPPGDAPPPPPPAPPPPPEALRQTPKKDEAAPAARPPPPKTDCRGITPEALTAVKLNKTPSKDLRTPVRNAQSTPVISPCAAKGGITPEALNSVRLKSTSATSTPKFYLENSNSGANATLKEGLRQRRAAMGHDQADSPPTEETARHNMPPRLDFDSDLRAALARRRSQVTSETDTPPGSGMAQRKLTPRSLELEKSAGTTVFKGDKEQEGLKKDKPLPPVPPSGSNNGRVGLSLKESVQISGVVAGGQVQKSNTGRSVNGANNQHSPPMTSNGFAGIKKDSGYTSSRNSLEPSECGDEPQTTNHNADDVIPESPDFPPPPPPEILNAQLNTQDETTRNRVSMLSQQLEDSIVSGKPPRPPPASTKPTLAAKPTPPQQTFVDGDRQDAMSVTSTLSTLSGCSETPSYASSNSRAASQHSPLGDVAEEMPAMPPPDYDTADSGTGDSESEDVTPSISRQNLAGKNSCVPFSEKKLPVWDSDDVMDWLDSLYLSEYKRAFARAGMDGTKLMSCDRAQFTKLGVTRIAHRIAMENSLKTYRPTNTTAF